jgi:spore coat protein CotH
MQTIRTLSTAGLLLLLVLFDRPAFGQTADELFDSNALQRIDLTINSRDWEKLKANFQENTYYPLTVSWRGQTIRNAWVRSRGNGSRSGTKPGLRLDFNRNASGPQEYLGMKSLILDNFTQDSSGMHEILTTGLFARMGLPTMREAFTQLYVNNKYAGLYVVIEPIDKSFLGRVFGADEDGHVENDGFLYEYKWRYPYLMTDLGSELEPYQELFEAKTHEHDSIAKLYQPLRFMVREVNDSRDDMFEANMTKYLDLPLFMRHVATQNAVAEWDGLLGYAGLNNFYLYQFEKKDRYQFLLWDADNTFHATDYWILSGHDDNVLMRRAMKFSSLRSTYFNTLLAAVHSLEEFSEDEAAADQELGIAPRGWLEREIDRLYALIRSSMRSDTFKPFSNDEFEDSVAFLRQFARERGPYVRCEVTKIVNPSKARDACQAQAAQRAR